jgi:hypothetical protein
MDMLKMIEGRRFLGREFLVWLWFESEFLEGQMSAPGVGEFEFLLEKQITLEAGGSKDKEQSKLRGQNPAATPEAREALRQGKTPTTASMKLHRGDQDFTFVFNAEQLAISGVKIPALMKDKDDEPFYDRIGLIEDLEAYMDALYSEFLLLRVTRAWSDLIFPAIQRWANDKPPGDAAAYAAARQTALVQARGKQKKQKVAA